MGKAIQGRRKRCLNKAIGISLMTLIGVIQAVITVFVGIGGLVLKALAVMLFGAAGILFFFADLPGMTALIVILTATGIFWVPELIGLLLVGTVFLQNKIADIFVRW